MGDGIGIFFLGAVDDYGELPSKDENLEILKMMERYADHEEDWDLVG